MAQKRIFCLLAFCCVFAFSVRAQYHKNMDAFLTVTNKLIPGQTHDLEFTFRLTNNDLEYGDSIAIEFPLGVTPNSVSNDPFAPVTEGQGPEVFNGLFGQVVSWGDNNDSADIGGIEAEKYFYFKVNVTVDPAISLPQQIRYFVSGDQMKYSPGGNPRDHEDSIIVEVQEPLPNLVLDFKRPVSEMYLHPANQLKPLQLSATVVNIGGTLEDYTGLVFEDAGNSFQVSRQIPTPMFTNDSVFLDAVVDYIPVKGNVARLKVYLTNPTDSDPSDNSDTVEFAVTDTVLSRTNGTAAGEISMPGSGALGTWMEITAKDTLTSVSLYLADPKRGDSLRISLYSFNSAGPDTVIISSRVFTVNNFIILPGWFHVTFPDTIILDSGKFFVAIEQLMDNRLTLAISPFNYFPQSNYVLPAGETVWQEGSLLDPIYEVNFLIRSNFGTLPPPNTVGIGERNEATLLVSPNPVDMWLLVEGFAGPYVIHTVTGQVAASGTAENGRISTAELPAGMYLLRAGGSQVKFIRQ
jgi:hypothetical protein